MIGLSSSYFASKGFSIYDSVKNIRELGFTLAEIGAAHKFEPKMFETIKKIKTDFPELEFTIHGLFPPWKENFWFNPALGLTPQNKKVIDNLFKAAEILEAEIISFHPGFLGVVEYRRHPKGYAEAVLTKKLNKEEATKKLFEVLDYIVKKNNSIGIKIALENINSNEDNALVSGNDFRQIFTDFPSLGLLFDVGHAIADNTTNSLIELKNKIIQIHLHVPNNENIHLPVQKEDLKLIQDIPNLKEIPIVLEHFKNIPVEEILEEKKLVEGFLGL